MEKIDIGLAQLHQPYPYLCTGLASLLKDTVLTAMINFQDIFLKRVIK